jgi:lipopolysaccharide biosynthesis glycosyltransferase
MSSSEPVPITVALASDERYFPGLKCAVASIMRSADPSRELQFHVLDGGIEESSKQSLGELLGTRPGTTISWLPLNDEVFKHAHLGPGKSRMAYARVLLAEVLDAPRCVYLDVDILVFRDLGEIFDLPLDEPFVFAAVPDSETLTLAADSASLVTHLGLPAEGEYFNSGFLLMNLKQLREECFAEAAINFLEKWRGHHTFHDQSVINFLMYGRIMRLDKGWNTASWQFDERVDFGLDCNVHYTSSAPWLVEVPGPSQYLFEAFAGSIGVTLQKESMSFRKARKRRFLRAALAPVRVISHGAAVVVYKLVRKPERSASYRASRNYWIKFILSCRSRRRAAERGIRDLEKLVEAGVFPEVGLGIPSHSAREAEV